LGRRKRPLPSSTDETSELSLRRRWHCQRQRIAARELLTPNYRWSIQGFETADLQEAKALFKALA